MNNIINIAHKLSQFNETWTPKIIAELNGQQVKLAKLKGDLAWHSHEHEDELFYILQGSLLIQIKDESGNIHDVHLNQGDMYIVPKGVEHNPVAENEVSVLLFEPAETKHTGDLMIDRTVTNQERI